MAAAGGIWGIRIFDANVNKLSTRARYARINCNSHKNWFGIVVGRIASSIIIFPLSSPVIVCKATYHCVCFEEPYIKHHESTRYIWTVGIPLSTFFAATCVASSFFAPFLLLLRHLFATHILHFPHTPFEMMIFVHWISMLAPNVYRSTRLKIYPKRKREKKKMNCRSLSRCVKQNSHGEGSMLAAKNRQVSTKKCRENCLRRRGKKAKISRIKSVSFCIRFSVLLLCTCTCVLVPCKQWQNIQN